MTRVNFILIEPLQRLNNQSPVHTWGLKQTFWVCNIDLVVESADERDGGCVIPLKMIWINSPDTL